MNTNQSDIDKAAKKIIAGMERIHRFVDKYQSYLSKEDTEILARLVKELDQKLNSEIKG